MSKESLKTSDEIKKKLKEINILEETIYFALRDNKNKIPGFQLPLLITNYITLFETYIRDIANLPYPDEKMMLLLEILNFKSLDTKNYLSITISFQIISALRGAELDSNLIKSKEEKIAALEEEKNRLSSLSQEELDQKKKEIDIKFHFTLMVRIKIFMDSLINLSNPRPHQKRNPQLTKEKIDSLIETSKEVHTHFLTHAKETIEKNNPIPISFALYFSNQIVLFKKELNNNRASMIRFNMIEGNLITCLIAINHPKWRKKLDAFLEGTSHNEGSLRSLLAYPFVFMEPNEKFKKNYSTTISEKIFSPLANFLTTFTEGSTENKLPKNIDQEYPHVYSILYAWHDLQSLENTTDKKEKIEAALDLLKENLTITVMPKESNNHSDKSKNKNANKNNGLDYQECHLTCANSLEKAANHQPENKYLSLWPIHFASNDSLFFKELDELQNSRDPEPFQVNDFFSTCLHALKETASFLGVYLKFQCIKPLKFITPLRKAVFAINQKLLKIEHFPHYNLRRLNLYSLSCVFLNMLFKAEAALPSDEETTLPNTDNNSNILMQTNPSTNERIKLFMHLKKITPFINHLICKLEEKTASCNSTPIDLLIKKEIIQSFKNSYFYPAFFFACSLYYPDLNEEHNMKKEIDKQENLFKNPKSFPSGKGRLYAELVEYTYLLLLDSFSVSKPISTFRPVFLKVRKAYNFYKEKKLIQDSCFSPNFSTMIQRFLFEFFGMSQEKEVCFFHKTKSLIHVQKKDLTQEKLLDSLISLTKKTPLSFELINNLLPDAWIKTLFGGKKPIDREIAISLLMMKIYYLSTVKAPLETLSSKTLAYYEKKTKRYKLSEKNFKIVNENFYYSKINEIINMLRAFHTQCNSNTTSLSNTTPLEQNQKAQVSLSPAEKQIYPLPEPEAVKIPPSSTKPITDDDRIKNQNSHDIKTELAQENSTETLLKKEKLPKTSTSLTSSKRETTFPLSERTATTNTNKRTQKRKNTSIKNKNKNKKIHSKKTGRTKTNSHTRQKRNNAPGNKKTNQRITGKRGSNTNLHLDYHQPTSTGNRTPSDNQPSKSPITGKEIASLHIELGNIKLDQLSFNTKKAIADNIHPIFCLIKTEKIDVDHLKGLLINFNQIMQDKIITPKEREEKSVFTLPSGHKGRLVETAAEITCLLEKTLPNFGVTKFLPSPQIESQLLEYLNHGSKDINDINVIKESVSENMLLIIIVFMNLLFRSHLFCPTYNELIRIITDINKLHNSAKVNQQLDPRVQNILEKTLDVLHDKQKEKNYSSVHFSIFSVPVEQTLTGNQNQNPTSSKDSSKKNTLAPTPEHA